jgi:N-methylhydantoinase A
VVVLGESGHRVTTKALTTPGDPGRGVLDGLDLAARELGVAPEDLLARTVAFVHGTTVGTNALAQRRGARTGLLMTRGHEQTIIIGRVRQKITGLSEREKIHVTHLHKAEPPIVAPEDIRGVAERLDARGAVVVPLDEAGARAAVDDLVRSGIEALAVCLLFSFLEPSHERRIAEWVRGRYPDLYISISSEVAPRLGEYERCVSTVFNSYIGPTVGDYVARLETALKERGLRCSLLVMQSNGGLAPVESVRRRPLLTVDSGPAGGVLGSAFFAGLLEEANVICADVGGTTFDVGLVFGGRVQMDRAPVVGQYAYLVPKLYVKSIGAGGGSIAWMDAGGSLRVGPRSAGAVPGPVAYGRGGTEPTVTDAHLALGYLDPAFRLGGHVPVARAASAAALAQLGRRLGMEMVELAAGIMAISSAQMADLMRKVTVERGLDPRAFAVFAYGGAGPVYAAFLARQIGSKIAYVPADSGVFSALGMLTTDFVFQEERSLLVRPPCGPDALAAVNGLLDDLSRRVRERFAAEGFTPADVRLTRSVDMRFSLQVHELDVDTSDGPVDPAEVERLCAAFVEKYELTYGRNSAYVAAGMEMVTFRAIGTLPLERPRLDAVGEGGGVSSVIGAREAWFAEAGGFTPTEVHAGHRLSPGQTLAGPSIIQRMGDTVVIPPGWHATVDGRGSLVLRETTRP